VVKSITSRSNPVVSTFRDLAAEADPDGLRLLLDGTHLVREARDAGLGFECVAIGLSTLDDGGEPADLARSIHDAGHEVIIVSEPVLRAISPVRTPSGLVAIALRSRTASPGTLLPDPDAWFLVVADIQDPRNLGALIRVAEAAGMSQVVVCGASAHPYGWRALRGSMGSTLRIAVTRFPDLTQAMEALHASSTRMIAAVPREGRDPDDVSWKGRVALVLGSEGPGLSQAEIDRCDELVTIPMQPPVESLNVASAAAILAYAARRQRLLVAAGRRGSNNP
jgi:TrmH family RNA methyltransferase